MENGGDQCGLLPLTSSLPETVHGTVQIVCLYKSGKHCFHQFGTSLPAYLQFHSADSGWSCQSVP